MNNIYYYTFYLLTNQARKINSKDKDPVITGMIWLSLPIFLNVESLFMLANGTHYHESEGQVFIKIGTMGLSVLLINYYLLIRNKKYQQIIEFFDEKYKHTKHNTLTILLIIIFFVFSFASCIYIAKQGRDKQSLTTFIG